MVARSRRGLLAAAALALLASLSPGGAVVLTPSMKTFGAALKSFPYPGCVGGVCHEQVLFQFNETVGDFGTPHTITEQWFALFGGGDTDVPYNPNPDARIRVYIDGNEEPDLDYSMFFAHTVGVQSCKQSGGAGRERSTCTDPRVPWSSSEVQHMSHAGALVNRYRIPFGTSIRITATMNHTGIIYYYARGMTNLPVVVGDLQLPNDARLVLHKNWNVVVPPLGRLSLVPKRNNSGLLYATMWSAESEYIGFMEGCVRAEADDGPTTFLSSGTEDYFESSNFFNAGQGPPPWNPVTNPNNKFTSKGEVSSPQSGVGYLNGTNPTNYSMSAYKFHLSDPIVWWKSFELTASNYDAPGRDPATGSLEGCSAPLPPYPLGKPVTMWTYAWTYEW